MPILLLGAEAKVPHAGVGSVGADHEVEVADVTGSETDGDPTVEVVEFVDGIAESVCDPGVDRRTVKQASEIGAEKFFLRDESLPAERRDGHSGEATTIPVDPGDSLLRNEDLQGGIE
jgi:hypothetical protein